MIQELIVHKVTFYNKLNTDIGLQLEILGPLPFLNRGLTTGYFKQTGNIPRGINLLHIWVKG
jgi:hypothetical protein